MRASFHLPGVAVTVGAVLAAPLLAWAAPAQAAAAGGGSARAAAAGAVINTPYFAGYQAPVAAGSATSSAARFKIPALACTSADTAITPVAGVVVNNYATYSSAFLFVGCRNGAAVYFPALVVNGNDVNYTTTPLSAGDAIKVRTTVTTTGTTVQVTDVTKAITKKRTGPGATASAAYVGDSGWYDSAGTLLGVPIFGTLTFTGCFVDGTSLAGRNPAQYQRVNSSNIVQIATGALSTTGTTFTTHYKHP